MNKNATTSKLWSRYGLNTSELLEDRDSLEFNIRVSTFIEDNYESDMFAVPDESSPDYTSKQDWHEFRLELDRLLGPEAKHIDD